MAYDDVRNQGDEQPRPEDVRHDETGPITVATTDPVIDSVVEHQSDWKRHPDTTVRVETSQVSDPGPLYAPGVRTVVVEDPHRDDRDRQDEGRDNRGRGQDDRLREDHDQNSGGRRSEQGKGKDKDRDDSNRDRDRDRRSDQPRSGGKEQSRSQDRDHDRDEHRGDRAEQDHDRDERDDDRDHDHDDRPGRKSQPSTMRNLVVTAGVALLCGVIGAVGYSYFFGSKDKQSGDSSQGKSESAKKNASSSRKSGGGGKSKDSGKQSNSQASTSDSIPGFTSAEDADTLKKQIMDLMQRVDRLGERVDRMTRPKDQTPPVLRTMQIKMGELAREMDEVSSLPARLRHDENRLETLQEDIRAIRVRLESMPGAAATATARMAPGLSIPPGSTASGPSGDARDPSNPTMDLGISLLERGQFASAREVFLRLQVAQPDDARVWYLSALAEGLTKDDWTGEARRLADRGLECERAGHPDTARIDAALATTTPIKGQDWVASLRRRVLGTGNVAGAGGK